MHQSSGQSQAAILDSKTNSHATAQPQTIESINKTTST